MRQIRRKKQLFDPKTVLEGAIKQVKKEEIAFKNKFYDIISFSKEILGLNLFPAQRIVLTFFYAGSRYNENLRLTDEDLETIKSWSLPQPWLMEGEKSKYKSYLKNLENFAKNPSTNYFRELILILGRRSGKSWVSSLISVYEAYKLVSTPTYFEEMGIPDGDVWIINTATTGPQAESTIFRQIRRFVHKCPMFEGRIDKDNTDHVTLFTDQQLEENKKLRETGEKILPGCIVLASGNSNSAALRGHTSSCIIYDEMAHFLGEDGKASADSTYQALQPSVANLIWAGEGRNIIISSPDLPSGFFYEHFENFKTEDTALVFQIPTWDANPRITREQLEPEFKSDPDKAAAEYGAQFRFYSASNFFPKDYLDAAAIRRKDWMKSERGSYAHRYYMHIDPAKNSDRWAVMIGHPEFRYDEKTSKSLLWVVEDYSRTFSPQSGETLDPDVIMDTFIIPLLKKFNICCITADQFFSLEQQKKIKTAGYNFKEVCFNGINKNKYYTTLKDFFINGRIELCNDDTDLIGELKNITIDYSKNPPRISKTTTDKMYPNDDLCDCLSGIAYSMSQGPAGITRLPRSKLVRTNFR